METPTQWIEVFRTGTHTDHSGRTRTWTTSDLDTIVSKYNPASHEAPVVLGHPESNAPAYGWVAGFRRNGNVLEAELKDLQPEFVEWVRDKKYKKRSLSLYSDLTPRHVGFLGAMPPAVRGLRDVSFSAEEGLTTIEFDEWRVPMIGRILGSLRDFIIEKFGIDAADRIVNQYELSMLQSVPDADADTPAVNAYTEQSPAEERNAPDGDANSQTTDMSETAQTDQTNERLRALEAQNATLQAELDRERNARRRQEFEEFCNGLQTRILPAERQDVLAFMEILTGAGEYQFAEGDTASALERFKRFLGALPERISFSEIATTGVAAEAPSIDDAQKLARAAVEFQEAEAKAGRVISVTEAVDHIKKESAA